MGFLCFGRKKEPSPTRIDIAQQPPISSTDAQESVAATKQSGEPAKAAIKMPGRKTAPLVTPKLAVATRRTEGSREKIDSKEVESDDWETQESENADDKKEKKQEVEKISANSTEPSSPKEPSLPKEPSRPESPMKQRPSSPRSLTSPKPAPIGPMGLKPIFAIDQQDELKKALARRFKLSEGNLGEKQEESPITQSIQHHPQSEESIEK